VAEAALSFERLAAIVERLAVLLEAGVAPGSAWNYLGGSTISSIPEVAAVAAGTPIARAGRSTAWRGLAAAWAVATDAGAPLAPTLQRFAASLRDLEENERSARTALAGPTATTRLVMVLPVVGVLFGLALGFDTLRTLFLTGPGLACLGAGVLLIGLARWWSHRLLRAARPASVVPGLSLDLVAIALSGGASVPRALAAAASACAECGLPGVDPAVHDILELSTRAGVPAGTLLHSAADAARRDARSAGARAAETFSVTLMLPLGLCVLPAFMLLAVAPLMIAVVSSTVGSL
jgi:tight adherence protein B